MAIQTPRTYRCRHSFLGPMRVVGAGMGRLRPGPGANQGCTSSHLTYDGYPTRIEMLRAGLNSARDRVTSHQGGEPGVLRSRLSSRVMSTGSRPRQAPKSSTVTG